MKLASVRRAYKEFRPRLPGFFLVSLIHCVPVYVFTWYFSLIDDLSARISISLLVTILPVAELLLPVAELLSEPKRLKLRGEQYWLALFLWLALLLVASGLT